MSRQLLLCLALLGAACGRVEGVPADAGPPDAEPFVCETQADCEVLSGCGEWNECSGFDGCREDGEQQRVCNQYDCGPAGVCVVTESHVEKQPCSRDRTGDECGAKTCGEYTACDAPGDTCARAGTRSRSCDVDVCQGGECVATVREEVASCERATDALPCGEDCVATGECVYAGECNESGSQPGTCTARICVGRAKVMLTRGPVR